MVTHVPPPSPSLSSTSFSTVTGSIPPHNRRSSSRAPSHAPSSAAQRYIPSSYLPPLPPSSSFRPPTNFPPSPPLSHSYASSSLSSDVAPRLPENSSQSTQHPREHAPSIAGSRITTATATRDSSRYHRHRSSAQSQAESRHHSRRHSGRAPSVASSYVDSGYTDEHNEFPWFGQTGDVEITLNTRDGRVEKRYMLHNLILKQNSKWWKHQLDSVQSGPFETSDRERSQEQRQNDDQQNRTRSTFSGRSSRRRSERQSDPSETASHLHSRAGWRFELDWTTESAHDGIPMLVTCPAAPTHDTSPSRLPTARNRPPVSNTSFFRNLTSRYSRRSSTSTTTSNALVVSSTSAAPPPTSQEDMDIFTAYASLFSSIYNHAPTLDPNSLADAYVQSKTLLRLAAQYQALPVIRPRIEHHLLHFNRALYKQIARYPPSYLKLGHLLRSRKIFGEALIHVVGQWPLHAKYLDDADERVRDLVDDKSDELKELRDRVDGKLFRIGLVTGRGDRVGPSTSFLDWMAVCLFRQWVADVTSPSQKQGILKSPADAARPRSHGGARPEPLVQGRAYRRMAKGADAYLARPEVKEFLKHQAPRECYTREGLKRLERRVEEVKALARDAVRGLNRSFLEYEDGEEYLTCVKAEERDYQWVWGGGEA